MSRCYQKGDARPRVKGEEAKARFVRNTDREETVESNDSLKDQLARLQEDLKVVRFPDNSDDLDEFAPEDEFEEYEELAELYPQIQPENEYPPEDPAEFK